MNIQISLIIQSLINIKKYYVTVNLRNTEGGSLNIARTLQSLKNSISYNLFHREFSKQLQRQKTLHESYHIKPEIKKRAVRITKFNLVMIPAYCDSNQSFDVLILGYEEILRPGLQGDSPMQQIKSFPRNLKYSLQLESLTDQTMQK